MKILHVITSLLTGGAEKLMVDLLPRFKAMGHEVDLCVFKGVRTPFYEQLENLGIHIIPLSGNRSVYSMVNLIKLANLIRKGGYDIIHTHNTACQLYAAMASVLCSANLVTTEHTTSNRRRDWKWYAYVDRLMYSRYAHIISISEATENNLRAFIGEKGSKISTIYNGIDVVKYQTASPLDRAFNKHIITMVAGFRYQKDYETVIRAAKILPSNYEMWFVGDGERRHILESLIMDLQVEDKVRLLGIRADVPSILKSSDVIVMSSHWEGFGLAAVEGMAAGKPIIASNVEGLAQVVEGAGVLFPQGDERTLALEIQKLIENADYRQLVIERCQERAKQYDISIMADNYIKVYKELLSKNSIL